MSYQEKLLGNMTFTSSKPDNGMCRVERHWLSSKELTITVEVENELVTWAPPIGRKFIGAPLAKLIDWMTKQGGLRHEVIE